MKRYLRIVADSSVIRCLRIAMALLCLVACLALIYGWCRSHRWPQVMFAPETYDLYIAKVSSDEDLAIAADRGQVTLYWFHTPPEYEALMEKFYGLNEPGRGIFYFFHFISSRTLNISFSLPIFITGALAVGLVPSWTLAAFRGAASLVQKVRIPRRFSLGTLVIITAIAAAAMALLVTFFARP